MSEKLQNALNEQITAELWSANLYLSMSFYLKKKVFQVWPTGCGNNLQKKWDMRAPLPSIWLNVRRHRK